MFALSRQSVMSSKYPKSHGHFAETVRDCPQLFDGLRRYCLCPTAATKDTGD